jgi:hypothetical protein
MGKLSTKDANIAASRLWDMIERNQQWNLRTVENFLPEGWVLGECDEADFYPFTRSHLAAAFRLLAQKESGQ